MRKPSIFALCSLSLLLSSCSPRDFLTRRLAADLIASSDTFRSQQQFQLRTGVVSNKDYLSPDYLALQHHGWISATIAPCPPALAPPRAGMSRSLPRAWIPFKACCSRRCGKQSFSIPAARRELVAITGIAKQGNVADVDFTWRWIPLNEVGAALYSARPPLPLHRNLSLL